MIILIYSLENWKDIPIKGIILFFEQITNKKVTYQINSRRVLDLAILIASPEKIKKELNFKPLYRNIDQIVFYV